jgi:hypothetical protein
MPWTSAIIAAKLRLSTDFAIGMRKNLSIEKGKLRLLDDYVYFFYLTNDWGSTPAAIVFAGNQRCNQENLTGQLKGGVRAFQEPVDNQECNWAYRNVRVSSFTIRRCIVRAPSARDHRGSQEINIATPEPRTWRIQWCRPHLSRLSVLVQITSLKRREHFRKLLHVLFIEAVVAAASSLRLLRFGISYT